MSSTLSFLDLFLYYSRSEINESLHASHLDPNKQNQDEYGIKLKFGGEETDALFCVYDGHGGRGHDCARFAREKFPTILAKYIRKKRVKCYQDELKAAGQSTKGSFNPTMWPKLSVKDYEAACFRSLVELNQVMHDDDQVSDTCHCGLYHTPSSSFLTTMPFCVYFRSKTC